MLADLMTAISSETQDEILRLLKKNTAAIHKMYSKARSIRSAQGVEDEESSFSWSQTSIAYNLSHSFDEELAGSSAYQKAQEAAAEDLFAQRLKLLEEKFALGKLCFCRTSTKGVIVAELLNRRET